MFFKSKTEETLQPGVRKRSLGPTSNPFGVVSLTFTLSQDKIDVGTQVTLQTQEEVNLLSTLKKKEKTLEKKLTSKLH